MRRVLAFAAAALLAGSACGKISPPVRTTEPPQKPAAKPSAPAPPTTPDEDPNALPTKPPETAP